MLTDPAVQSADALSARQDVLQESFAELDVLLEDVLLRQEESAVQRDVQQKELLASKEKLQEETEE